MKKIIFTRPDGGLSVMHPQRNIGETLSDEEIVQRAWAKLPADAINPQIVEESVIPTDRSFRDAWRASGSRIVHDMGKCREIHREKLRALRAPKLLALDVEYMRADEAGDAVRKAAIVARKNALRDVTADPSIDSATSPDQLRVPDVLK